MLRRLQVVSNKNIDASYVARAAMKRGTLVVKDYENKTVSKAVALVGVYFANKDNYPTGLLSLQGELSDYDSNFEDIKQGDPVLLEAAVVGEVYGTDQFVAEGLDYGDYLTVGTTVGTDDGLFVKLASGTSNFKYAGTLTDSGNTLAIVEVV